MTSQKYSKQFIKEIFAETDHRNQFAAKEPTWHKCFIRIHGGNNNRMRQILIKKYYGNFKENSYCFG